MPAKAEVRAALRAALEEALRVIVRAAEQTREGAVHAESRSEGDKDMRATEQSYLARGQAMRAEELAEQIQRLDALPVTALGASDAIVAGALVRVQVDDQPRLFYVVPWGGGTELHIAGSRITVVTPSSPVGAALLGKRPGDGFELPVRGAVREWEIDAVA
jgi:transcription elongation GreA/GreB family factor